MTSVVVSLPGIREIQASKFGSVTTPETTHALTDGAGAIALDPSEATWCWRFTEHGPSGRTRYCLVPDTSSVGYAALVDVDPGTLMPTVGPTDPAWEATAQAANVAAAAAVAATAAIGLNVKTQFGAAGTGLVSDAAAFDALVAHLNANGSLNGNVPLTAVIPAGVYDLRAGGIQALTVSNITIRCDPQAIFILRDGPVWTLGNGSATVVNIWITGGQPRCNPGDTLGSTCSWVYGVNCAGVFIDNQRYTRCQIFKGVSSTTLASIWIRWHSGSGPADRHWVEIDTTANPASAAAGLYLVGGGGYAYLPPANPATTPSAITGATQANPVQVTSASHGLTTGDRVRLGGVAGMTQLNGVDATVTVINSSTYTLNGVDGSGFSAYTSGGWAAKLHWSWPYDTAVVGIKGHWDTVKIQGGLYQHWAWLWSIESRGTVSFLFDEEVTWDYGGKGRFDIYLNGGSISNIKVNGGWHFCMNEEWFRQSAPGSGFVTDVTVRDHTLGMTGKDFFYDSLGKVLNVEVDGLRVAGMGRARVGTCHLVRPGSTGNNNATIRRIRSESPLTYYANGSTYLRPDVGVKVTANTRYTVTDNEIDALTTHYDISPTDVASNRLRLVRNNKCRLGGLPEYVTTATVPIQASGVDATNHTGLIQTIYLRGGTLTAVTKGGTQILTAPGVFTVAPGETWSATYSVAPTMAVSYAD